MSDDEGGDDYGDYEDIGVGPEGEDETVVPGTETEREDEEEKGLEEDAAGSEEEEEEGEGEGEGEPEPEPGEIVPGPKAHPQRQKVDPILRMSNKPRTIVVIPADERTTDNRLQKTEAALIIAKRAAQIARSRTSFTDAPGLHDPVSIAYKELFDRRTPLLLRRQVGTGPAGEQLVEEWSPREMALPPLPPPTPLGPAAAK